MGVGEDVEWGKVRGGEPEGSPGSEDNGSVLFHLREGVDDKRKGSDILSLQPHP